MEHTYKNLVFKLDGVEFITDSVSFNLRNSSESTYREGNRNSYQYSANNGVLGDISISYSLTGNDPVKNYIENPSGMNPISGYVGGLYFTSGYIENYSVNLSRFKSVKASASIKIFDSLSGTFSPAYESVESRDILHVNDVTITGCSIGALEDIDSISYNFNQSLNPQYQIGAHIPEKVLMGKKKTSLNINTTNISGYLLPEGQKGEIEFTLTHPNNSTINETYCINGEIKQKSSSSQLKDFIRSTISIEQGYVNKKPEITLISETIRDGVIATIRGNNLDNVERVLFCINGETTPRGEALILERTSNNQIRIKVPRGVSAGSVELV